MNCEVPGCTGLKVLEDVCTQHGGASAGAPICGAPVAKNPNNPCGSRAGHKNHHSDASRRAKRRVQHGEGHILANDGIIDWLAIELAVQGDRMPRLSWVEREIAAAIMLNNGATPYDIDNALHIHILNPDRRQRVESIAQGIRHEGKPRA